MRSAEQHDHISPLGRLIRERRSELGLSLRQLEELSGVDNAALSRLEAGQYTSTNPKHFDALAAALDIPVNVILSAVGIRKRPTRLPSLSGYLKARYGHAISHTARRELETYLREFQQRHGLRQVAPIDRIDELPDGHQPAHPEGKRRGRSD